MTEISFRGTRAFYKTWGHGPPLLLLHAGGSSGAQWTKMGDVLAGEHAFIAPDLLGFGATEPWPQAGVLTHDLQADLVAQIIEAEGAMPLDIVGHSYGGATAVRLVLRRPELVRSLVLIEPIMSWLLKDAGDPLYDTGVSIAKSFVECVQAGRPEAGWETFIDSRNGAGTWARMSDQTRGRFLAQSQQTLEGFISNLNNRTSLADCRSIAVPVTVVCGGVTTAPDRRTTELLKDAIAHAHYEVIASAAHMSPFTHPVDVAQIVREHVARIAVAD